MKAPTNKEERAARDAVGIETTIRNPIAALHFLASILEAENRPALALAVKQVAEELELRPLSAERAQDWAHWRAKADEYLKEIEEFKKIRELLIKSLMKATGKSREAIEEAPFTCACEHASSVDAVGPMTPTTDSLARKWETSRGDASPEAKELYEHARSLETKLMALREHTSAIAAPVGSGLYVASRVKQAEVWKAYRAKGWKINASWIDEAGEGETLDFGELWARIRDEIARSYALVFYAAGVEDFPFKGALVEVGMALAMGKPVIVALENVMLDGRTMRPVGSWLLDRNVVRCDTLDEAMEIARGAEILKRARSDSGAVPK